ncbi:MAG TPA: hypothetical protein VG867_11815, partial [Rhizomicrobium sp.]|nr:hypothetical protein [Rhizomicrobium sp.]
MTVNNPALCCSALESRWPSGLGDFRGRQPCAPHQERTITSVTTAGAEAGFEEATSATSVSEPVSTETNAQPSFNDLGLSPEILKAVAESGYTTP